MEIIRVELYLAKTCFKFMVLIRIKVRYGAVSCAVMNG